MLATPLRYPFKRVIQSHYNDTLPAVTKSSEGDSVIS